MWAFDYLKEEVGVQEVYRDPIQVELGGKRFFLGHGDGLGPGDNGYKFIKKVFASRLCQWLFARIHPNLGISIAEYWSKRSRIANGVKDEVNHGDEEWLTQYCKKKLKEIEVDYFIFGHRHLPLDIDLGNNTRYINLGEWVNYNSYAVFDGEKLELKTFS
jgi:UDP-2,3-diacylglucosamine hydrolase